MKTVSRGKNKGLAGELATRQSSMDWSGFFGYLPNPDPILRENGKDIDVYRDLLVDSHLSTVVQSRFTKTLSKKWYIEKNDSPPAVVDFVKECFKVIDIKSASRQILEAILYGYSPMEIVWEVVDGKIKPVKFEGKPPEWFFFNESNELRFRSMNSQVDGEEIEPFKVILVRNQATYTNPYGDSLLSKCYWPVNFKKGGYKFWVDYAEKNGSPFAIGKVARDKGLKEMNELADLLEELISGSVAVIPDDGAIEFLSDPSKSATTDLYKSLLEFSNNEVSKAVLGQTLTTEAGVNGARSLGEVHNEVRNELSEMDENLVEGIYQTLIEYYVQLNFGDNTKVPKFSFAQE